MKRIKIEMGIIIALAMLLSVGCQDKEVLDNGGPGTGKLQFSPILGEAHTASRAGESDNNVLKAASPVGETSAHIAIETYTGTPGNSLESYFSEKLGYFNSGDYWDINSGIPRFLPSGGMNLYAYFATNVDQEGDLTNVTYAHPAKASAHPTLTFTVAENDALDQVDLIAAKVEGIVSPNVQISFRHILSQINFGVKGISQSQITVKNIRINEVKGKGIFDYKTWVWTPDGGATPHKYPYYFPNRIEGEKDSGLGTEYKTQGTSDDSQNNYFFGDGGKFGPGEDGTFLYAQVNPSESPAYATKENTPAPLHNSLMLLPQKITKNTAATVTFDYEIKMGDQVVRWGENNVVRLDAYYDWEPNYRYVYLFEFDDPEKVTFDVIVEPWLNYNGGDGIVGTDELNSANLFNKYVRSLMPDENYLVPIGPLTKDFVCDWSFYTLDNSFGQNKSFTISFDDVPFTKGKSVIIKPPFGFTASASLLKGKGTVTFTASPYSYYSTSEAVQTAIGNGGGNYEFSVSDAVKLDEITFRGSATAESSLALHFPTPYSEEPPSDSKWNVYDKVAVCLPNDYSLTKTTAPYSYTIYTVQGLYAVLNWMDKGGLNPGGDSNASPLDIKGRMQTNINLFANSRYNLAEAYGDATNGKAEYVPIGTGSNPYSGTFDGKGATISNLYLHASYLTNWRGLFGYINGSSKVQHLNLTNVSVVTGDWFVSGLIGFNGGGTVTGCSVQGTIQGPGVTGGIAGQNSGFIYACSSTAAVSNGTFGGITGDNWGQVWSCYVTNCNNVVGANNNTIITSYCVTTSDSSTPAGVSRVPSIAALNGKIGELNATIINVPAHFVSGIFNATPPSAVAGFPARRLNGGVLKGTFIQNSYALSWDQDRWNEEMAVLATLGMEYLVLDQVMEYSDYAGGNQYISWYPASAGVLVNDPGFTLNASPTALEYCMTACRAHGIKLFIGTFFDKRYWDNGAAVANSAKWNNCITTANRVMGDLITKYFHGGANNYNDVLAGWYFPYEVDDFNFQSDPAKNVLKAGITATMKYRNDLTNLAVKKPYLFSPFMNGTGPYAIKEGSMNAIQYAALWGDILNSTGFQSGDILSPQDCIGTGKFVINDIREWMPKLRDVANAKGVEFWINVELFGASSTPFLLTEQIPASKDYATKLISFSYPIHYSPTSKDRQGDHHAYKTYYDAQ